MYVVLNGTVYTISSIEKLSTLWFYWRFLSLLCLYIISFPIVPNRLFSGRTKNNRHFGYPEMKITDFKISGTRLGMTLHHCRLILETETEPGKKSSFHYLCIKASCHLEINHH